MCSGRHAVCDDDISRPELYLWVPLAVVMSLFWILKGVLETSDWLFVSLLPWLYVLAGPAFLLTVALLINLPNRAVPRVWPTGDREEFLAAVTLLFAEYGYRRVPGEGEKHDFEERGLFRWRIVARCTFAEGAVRVQAPRLAQAYLRAHLPTVSRGGNSACGGARPGRYMPGSVMRRLTSVAALLGVGTYLGAINRWVPVPCMIFAAASGLVLLVVVYHWALPRLRLSTPLAYAAWLAGGMLPAIIIALALGVWIYSWPEMVEVWSDVQPPLIVPVDGAPGAQIELAQLRYRATGRGQGEYIGLWRNTGSVPVYAQGVALVDPQYPRSDTEQRYLGSGWVDGTLSPGAQLPFAIILKAALRPGEPLWTPGAVEVRARPITSTEELAWLANEANWPLQLVAGSVRIVPLVAERGYRVSGQVRNNGTVALSTFPDIRVEAILYDASGQLACTTTLYPPLESATFGGLSLPVPPPGNDFAPGDTVTVKGSAHVCAAPVESYEIVLQRRPYYIDMGQ